MCYVHVLDNTQAYSQTLSRNLEEHEIEYLITCLFSGSIPELELPASGFAVCHCRDLCSVDVSRGKITSERLFLKISSKVNELGLTVIPKGPESRSNSLEPFAHP